MGKQGEEIAVNFLKKKRHRIVDRNFHTRWGELDIVAEDKKTGEVVFVEVKTRRSARFARPEESVNYTKQDHLRKAAQIWLVERYPNDVPPCRFDVVAVVIDKDGGKVEIEHIPNAFT